MRDPKRDPKRSDVFRKNETTVEIYLASNTAYGFNLNGSIADSPPMLHWGEPWLPAFREWAKDAEVIHAAE